MDRYRIQGIKSGENETDMRRDGGCGVILVR